MASVSNNKISTFLWYENRAEEAANFYVSDFRELEDTERFQGAGGTRVGGRARGVRAGGAEILGGIDGGPMFSLGRRRFRLW